MAGLEYDYRRELAYFHLPFYYSISSGNQKLMVKRCRVPGGTAAKGNAGGQAARSHTAGGRTGGSKAVCDKEISFKIGLLGQYGQEIDDCMPSFTSCKQIVFSP
jgi:hypothetical protein